jgi:hypothetical protein
MKIVFWKKLEVPESNGTKLVDAAQMWSVRWCSRSGIYSSDFRPEIEVFSTEELAKQFAASLKNAFKLIKHTGEGAEIKVEKIK